MFTASQQIKLHTEEREEIESDANSPPPPPPPLLMFFVNNFR